MPRFFNMKKTYTQKVIGIGAAVGGLMWAAPLFAVETTYKTLAPLPGLPSNSSVTFLQYVPLVFNLLIGLSFALAFIMIVWGGVEYMSTDAIYGKSAGRERIKNALWGLLLVLGAYIILQTINPKLVSFRLDQITNPQTTTPTPPTN